MNLSFPLGFGSGSRIRINEIKVVNGTATGRKQGVNAIPRSNEMNAFFGSTPPCQIVGGGVAVPTRGIEAILERVRGLPALSLARGRGITRRPAGNRRGLVRGTHFAICDARAAATLAAKLLCPPCASYVICRPRRTCK